MQNLGQSVPLLRALIIGRSKASAVTQLLGSLRGVAGSCPPDHSWESDAKCAPPECELARRMDEVCPPKNECRRGPFKQTWAECPARIIELQPFCEGEGEPVYTPRKGRKPEVRSLDVVDKNEACMKITLPGCKPARKIVKCKRTRQPSDCVPVPTPCLSYSECEKDPTPPIVPSECNCFEKICEITDE